MPRRADTASDQVTVYAFCVCLICMPYVSALCVCLMCLPYVYALCVCFKCMPRRTDTASEHVTMRFEYVFFFFNI